MIQRTNYTVLISGETNMESSELHEKIYENAINQYNDNNSMWFPPEVEYNEGGIDAKFHFTFIFKVNWNGTEEDIKRLEHHGEGLIEDTDVQHLHVEVSEEIGYQMILDGED